MILFECAIGEYALLISPFLDIMTIADIKVKAGIINGLPWIARHLKTNVATWNYSTIGDAQNLLRIMTTLLVSCSITGGMCRKWSAETNYSGRVAATRVITRGPSQNHLVCGRAYFKNIFSHWIYGHMSVFANYDEESRVSSREYVGWLHIGIT